MKNSGTSNITALGGPRDRGNARVRCAAPSGVRRVYPAATDQEVVAWAGCWSMPVCEIDLRAGGMYR
jgi:hypothetical protein